MSDEIGGYLELESFSGAEYYPDAIKLNNARNALLYILKARQIRKIWIPCFLCGSVSAALDRGNAAYDRYHVGADLLPEADFRPEEGEAVYLVNYYGQLFDEHILDLRDRFGTVIVDNVQAFFQRPAEGVDAVYSCRKFFGVPDGGYALTMARLPGELEQDKSGAAMGYLLGRFESGDAGAWYAAFRENEARHDVAPLRGMSALTGNLLRAVNYEQVRKRREDNCALLAELLQNSNGMSFTVPTGPYAYPFYAENGPALRIRLAQEGIYIPMLWPDAAEYGNEIERRLAENILPLPCDQRYGAEQMERLSRRVLKNLI